MLQHIFPLITLQPSSLAFTLTLVASWLITAVQAESSLGTDAPAPKVTSQPSKSTGGSGGLSTTAKIVIGVVVSMVGISAICGSLFFFRKKKQRNEKIKHDPRINTYAYHDAKRAAFTHQQMPFRRQRQPDPEQGMIEIAKIERDAGMIRGSRTMRDSVIPKYDPSSFHRDQYSIDSARGTMSLDMPREPLMRYHHNRNSLSFSKAIAPLHLPPPPPPVPPMPPAVAWNRRSVAEPSNNIMQPNPPANDVSPAPAVQASLDSQARPKGPKKPKPTLARLITNL